MGFNVIASVLGGAANILTGVGNYNAQMDANQKGQESSREQMAFQERMSNTAHQREMVDLQQAGLNPNLAAGGNGASTPTGSQLQQLSFVCQ